MNQIQIIPSYICKISWYYLPIYTWSSKKCLTFRFCSTSLREFCFWNNLDREYVLPPYWNVSGWVFEELGVSFFLRVFKVGVAQGMSRLLILHIRYCSMQDPPCLWSATVPSDVLCNRHVQNLPETISGYTFLRNDGTNQMWYTV